jgi:hypothetical protein
VAFFRFDFFHFVSRASFWGLVRRVPDRLVRTKIFYSNTVPCFPIFGKIAVSVLQLVRLPLGLVKEQ